MQTRNTVGYFRLLQQNPSFRNLWYGQVVSELGDWLNSIAIYALILKLSDSGMAMAGAMMAKLLPIVLVSPIAGVVVDRVSRKTVMIGSDLADEGGEQDDLTAASDFVSPGIELHNYRFWFGEPTSQELIASNGIHAGLVVGDPKMSPDSFDWDAEEVSLFLGGKPADRDGVGILGLQRELR